MNTSDPTTVCRRFFDAIEQRDGEGVGALVAKGAVLCRNGGTETPLKALAHPEVLASMDSALGRHRYEDVRQVVGDGVIAEQHRVRSTTPDGTVIDIDVCAVLRVNGEGKITRLDEYSDFALPDQA